MTDHSDLGLETTAEERLGARLLCEEVLGREENQQFPDFATVSLHATRVILLLRDHDRLAAALLRQPVAAEVEAAGRLLDTMAYQQEKTLKLDHVDRDTLRLVAALLRRLSLSPPEGDTKLPPASTDP